MEGFYEKFVTTAGNIKVSKAFDPTHIISSFSDDVND